MSASKQEQAISIACVSAVLFLALNLGFLSGCKAAPKKEGKSVTPLTKAPDIRKKLAKYIPTQLQYPKDILSEEDRLVLEKLVAAARHIDTIFWKQASAEGLALKERLLQSPDPMDRNYLHFLKINFGPFDRQDGNSPFIGTADKPLGAGFYPPDMTKKEFEDALLAHPETKTSFESPYSVIRRKDGTLAAVPYNEEYAADLQPIAQALREAAAITTNPSLKAYLTERADGLVTNDYYKSDCLWIDLKDNHVETVIGPFEVYEDALFGFKASYESFVYINDFEEMKNIKGYLNYLDEMQKNLPVAAQYKSAKAGGLQSPLNVVYEVFAAGGTKAGIQTSAFVLPNDEKVREEKGTKKVFLKNVMEAKFRSSLVPISEIVLAPEDAAKISFYAYFNETILHEICHALGSNYIVLSNGDKTSVSKALKELYSPIEEAKADVTGVYSVPLLTEKGWIPKNKTDELYVTYLAGMFRSVRFGVTEAHGLGVAMQFNFLREKKAFVYDPATEKYHVDQGKIRSGLKDLAVALLNIEGKGGYQEAKAFIERYGKLDEVALKTIEKLKDIPVDIEPIFLF